MVKTRKRTKIIEYEEAPSGAVRLYNYKEPFIPAPQDCYGFMGVLLHDSIEDKIQCHVCGEWLSSLSTHIKKHGFANVGQYKKEFGLSNTTALISEKIREKLIKIGLKNKKGCFKKGHKQIGQPTKKLSLEQRNLRGTCPLQLLDKLDKIALEIGHFPTHNDVVKITKLEGRVFSGRGLTRSIEHVFGCWDNAMIQIGRTEKMRNKNRKWNKDSLEEIYEKFLLQHKRFPTRSDCKRNVFPQFSLFRKHCGGMEQVKQNLLLKLIEKW